MFSVHGFHDPQRDLGPAVVQDAVQVIQDHQGEFLKGPQALPPQLIDPGLEVAQHGSFVAVEPETRQAFLEQIGFEQLAVHGE